jgi:hypothetical protein
MPVMNNPDSPNRGGRPSYTVLAQEKAALAETVDSLTRELAEQTQLRMEADEQLANEQKQHQYDNHGCAEALDIAARNIERARGEVPEGVLKFGCAHPYSAFPKDYNGTLVTDGTFWYCTFNHMRVGILSREGQA